MRVSGTQAMLVTSPVPMSSSRARRTMGFMMGATLNGKANSTQRRRDRRESAEKTFCPFRDWTGSSWHLGELGFVVRQLGAHAFDDLRGGFAEEDVVRELAFGVGDILFDLVALRSEEHTSELQSLRHLVCRLLL